jgi:hypothetical protein
LAGKLNRDRHGNGHCSEDSANQGHHPERGSLGTPSRRLDAVQLPPEIADRRVELHERPRHGAPIGPLDELLE